MLEALFAAQTTQVSEAPLIAKGSGWDILLVQEFNRSPLKNVPLRLLQAITMCLSYNTSPMAT